MTRTAAIVTVGSELVNGWRVDTNTAEIARELTPRGFRVAETVSIGDDVSALRDALTRLTGAHELVITTGGLGPTHDDITRQAASEALGVALERVPRLEAMLRRVAERYGRPEAADQILEQAQIIPGAEVIDPTTGTAPGQVISTELGALVLLPGPPSEMHPMLQRVLERYPRHRSATRELGVVGLPESQAQVLTQRALETDIGFTVLAKPGDVRVILSDEGAGSDTLDRVVNAVARELGAHCYARDGSTLAEVVVREAIAQGVTIAAAESCTGGLVAAALTDIAGASACFLGGVVSYSNEAKMSLLDVPAGLLAQFGAVSEEAVVAMATGAADAFGSDYAVSISGIAGPGGGTPDKPVGTVWFGLQTPGGHASFVRDFPGGGRASIRSRATSTALDALRRSLLGLPL